VTDPPRPRAHRAIIAARQALPEELRAVLAFWFGEPGEDGFGAFRKAWFEKDPAFDQAIRDRFEGLHARVHDGAFADLLVNPDAALALVVTLDQFPRNMFRGSPRAFASDARARAAARSAVGAGHDRHVSPFERWFFYLPFEHSEDAGDQERGVELFRELAWHEPSVKAIESAERHRDIVARFGRFPHRNAILGRATTEEEAAFLLEPRSSF
jgi:uncharacterized protein (DUF924 family)